MSSGKILIIDSDQFSCQLYRDILASDGHEVQIAGNEEQGRALLERTPFDVVVSESHLQGSTPFSILSYVNEFHPRVSVILTTKDGDLESAVYALKAGAEDYLKKPIIKDELKRIIQHCLEQQLLFREHREFESFLSLFEACHRISSCLEVERLVNLSLHVLGLELGAQSGFVASHEEGEDVETLPLDTTQGLDLKKMTALICEKAGFTDLLQCANLKVLEEINFTDKPCAVLLLPVLIDQITHAVFCLVIDRPNLSTTERDFLEHRAQFIGRQIGIAWDNARRFAHARGQAFMDDLTGLYNARYLSVALEKEIKRSRRFKSSLSVLFIDLDHFKTVNDTHGHLVGSQLLVEVATVLRSRLRDIDIAVRYGGDEFTIILVETDSGGASKVAERIRQAIERQAFLTREGKNLQVTACIGIAAFPEHAATVADLLDMADQAMYRGKNTTRNVVYIFNPQQ